MKEKGISASLNDAVVMLSIAFTKWDIPLNPEK